MENNKMSPGIPLVKIEMCQNRYLYTLVVPEFCIAEKCRIGKNGISWTLLCEIKVKFAYKIKKHRDNFVTLSRNSIDRQAAYNVACARTRKVYMIELVWLYALPLTTSRPVKKEKKRGGIRRARLF